MLQAPLSIEKQESSEAQSFLSEGSSSYRLHVLIAKDGSDKMDFTLHPVVFRPAQQRAKKSPRMPLSLSDPADAKDIARELAHLCYKREAITQKSLSYARKIQAAFVNNYLRKVNNVQLTEKNVADLLFSIVQYSDEPTNDESDTKMKDDSAEHQLEPANFGIITNYKVVRSKAPVEEEKDEILLFVNLFISAKTGSSTAWVSLKTTKVFADLSMGFVSQKWLEKY